MLHTKIPHHKLLTVLNELADFCFSVSIKKFVKVHSGKAFWTNVHHKHQITFSSDPASFMANLFLFHYEEEFMKSLKFPNIARARRFSYIYRFIDDVNSINDYGKFERCNKDIYPSQN